MAFGIRFDLKVDLKGYRIKPREPKSDKRRTQELAAALASFPKPPPQLGMFGDPNVGVPARIVRQGGSFDKPKRLDRFPTLYEIFARDAQTPEGVRKFVEKYGSLTPSGDNTERGDDVQFIIDQANRMQRFLTSSNMSSPGKVLAKLGDHVNVAPVDLRLVKSPDADEFSTELVPRSLLDGLWVQMALALLRNVDVQQCRQCQKYFERGPKSRPYRRGDATFCCTKHSVKFHSEQRSKK